MSRVLTLVVGAVVVLAGVYALAQVFVARDDAGVGTGGGDAAAARGPGTLEPDRGAEHGARAPAIATSGRHRPDLVTRDGGELSADQVIHALELGNVVLLSPAPARLRGLQEEVAGPFDAELAAAGQAVIVARGEELQALAWRRRLRPASPGDPALREFAEAWLGRGAPAPAG